MWRAVIVYVIKHGLRLVCLHLGFRPLKAWVTLVHPVVDQRSAHIMLIYARLGNWHVYQTGIGGISVIRMDVKSLWGNYIGGALPYYWALSVEKFICTDWLAIRWVFFISKKWSSDQSTQYHYCRQWSVASSFRWVSARQWSDVFYALIHRSPWWRHQMETFSALLAICAGISPVSGEFPAQRPVTRSFDVFFDLCLNKRLSKQSWAWWFETLSCPLWIHPNVQYIAWIIQPRGTQIRIMAICKYLANSFIS